MEILLLDSSGQISWSWRTASKSGFDRGKPAWCSLCPQCELALKSAVGLAVLGDTTVLPSVVHVGTENGISKLTVAPAPGHVVAVLIAEYGDSRISLLSGREREILAMLPSATRKAIARRLRISPSTVDSHVVRAGRKLHLSGKALDSWCHKNARVLRELA